ncbi:MAG: 1-aminocyclopropane-1-carboxylate deaminase/D-cysteine desulfhydrase [Sphingobacteriales bacterium]|nr:MAG: 1-aminocyclopropane-1-carboxylate deaminase/D-cysteine desulfhydrase [Sphingobacteriales bacterium]TAF78329.1 MAG: 1-aminocyclopropane-1-carboxylate deaminase/D-cysteine desulfhydrase [Sphingobacteriales bacterium]
MLSFDFSSPEEQVFYRPLGDCGINIFFKRDDVIHPFISGNKWRKLKHHLINAQQKAKAHIVTFGGAYSNHLLATAAAGAKFNFKTTAFVRGENVTNEVLSICKVFGMQLIFVDRESYKNKSELFRHYFANDTLAYFVDEGGLGAYAELGCREIISELKNHYDYIFCSVGTGTTLAGIINASNQQQLNTQIHGVSALKNGNFLKSDINKLLTQPLKYTLHTEYDFGGYAKTKPELIYFIKDFSSATGILIDPVYTAKTLYAILDLASKNYFTTGANILMVHTGGLFGLLGMKQKF